MGRQSYMIGEFDYASSWMREALHKYDLEKPECKTAELEHIFEFYAFSTYKQGNIQMGMLFNIEIINLFKGMPTI